MTVMDALKEEVALELVHIEKIFDAYGLSAMCNLTLFARDLHKPEMFVHLSNDSDCFPLVWLDASQFLPLAADERVLVVARPPGDGIPEFYMLAAYDHADGRWDTHPQYLPPDCTIVRWSCLPVIAQAQPSP
jgi:hypothetical protein